MNSKVVRLASIGLILVQAYSAQAATSTRADACRTYNVHGHQDKEQNGWDGDFCDSGYVQVEQERKVKHTDSTPTVATEQPVMPVIVVTPSPEPVLPIETPIACHDDEDDNTGGEDDAIDDLEPEDCEDTDDNQ